ncbi:MAG TPA: FAD:protein FMN transferase [Candidatus Nanopelagicaceae bacterium]|nr:FAD:protein FMN transferase [Candidatus Nanopelagicaceae bacterium]
MSRLVHPEEVWGTVVVIELRSDSLGVEELQIVRNEMTAYLHEVDLIFSTYKSESEVSAIRNGQLSVAEASPLVKEVWQLCLAARECTEGAFDPWAARGGFDPSGYVKGWAADRALEMGGRAGVEHIQINAGGDISLLGGLAVNEPWRIGIRHPDDDQAIAQIVTLADGAIATSGTYERGAHIIDPSTNLPAIAARSATVVGPDGGLADALATALIVAGRDGAHWFLDLTEYSAWVVERHGDQTWAIGPAFS